MSSVSGSSGDYLHLDPAELQIHADQLHSHASDLKDAHDAAHNAMTDAQARAVIWVGLRDGGESERGNGGGCQAGGKDARYCDHCFP